MNTALTASASFPASASAAPAAVSGAPKVLLRAEGAVMLLGSLLAFRATGGHWVWFAALFLAPDLAFLGYRFGARTGAIVYNAIHTYAAPAALAALAVGAGLPALLPFAAIWSAHIGFDRTLGYGLKYPTGFGHTHLGIKA